MEIPDEAPDVDTQTRPIGIAILSWLHMIGGSVSVVLTIFMALLFLQNRSFGTQLSSMGFPPSMVVFGFAFLSVLALASGVGMWRGQPRGWYLGTFYYMYGIIRNANALIMIPFILSSLPPEDLAKATHGPAFYYVKHSVRIVIHFLIYLYFFKNNVRTYFGLIEVKKWKPILMQVGVCLGLFAISTLLYQLTK